MHSIRQFHLGSSNYRWWCLCHWLATNLIISHQCIWYWIFILDNPLELKCIKAQGILCWLNWVSLSGEFQSLLHHFLPTLLMVCLPRILRIVAQIHHLLLLFFLIFKLTWNLHVSILEKCPQLLNYYLLQLFYLSTSLQLFFNIVFASLMP